MAAGTYTLDGLPLDDPSRRWKLRAGTGVRILPARRRTGSEYPGRDGITASIGSSFDPGAAKLVLQISGANHAELMERWELLGGVLGQRHRLLPLVHHYGNGATRTAMVEVLASTEPELAMASLAEIEVMLSVPGVYWRDAATVDASANITTTSTATTLTELAGTTGSINDALIRIKGAISSATITDPVSGDSITYNAALTDTQYVVIDTANWTARRHASASWATTGGSNVITSVVSSRGSGPMLTLNPDFSTGAGRVQLRVVGTNPATSPTVTVRAKRSFL